MKTTQKKFKAHSITLRNRIAVLQWEAKELNVSVMWATMTEKGLDIFEYWPSKDTPERIELDSLLSKVREYCSVKNLNLYSY